MDNKKHGIFKLYKANYPFFIIHYKNGVKISSKKNCIIFWLMNN